MVALEQAQRLLEQRARVCRRPLESEPGGAQVYGRGEGRVEMAGEAAIGLLGKHAPTGYVADGPEGVKASHVHLRQAHAGELLRVRHLFEEFDGPLPVPSRLGVVEHVLRGLSRAHPGG
jgi:hypothetical protein